ncbi:hypothetical protein BgiBS90_026841, partial [Biomphalaria glabrata]
CVLPIENRNQENIVKEKGQIQMTFPCFIFLLNSGQMWSAMVSSTTTADKKEMKEIHYEQFKGQHS